MHMRRFARAAVAAVGLAALRRHARRCGRHQADRAAQPVRGQRQGQSRGPGPRGLRPHRGAGHGQARLRDRRDAVAGRRPGRQGRDGRARWRARRPPPGSRRPDPLTDPTHGYDVFRPWSLKPAPCPHDLRHAAHARSRTSTTISRARNADVVKEYVYRQERPRPGPRRLQGHQERAQRAGRQPPGGRLRVHAARARVDRRRDRSAGSSSTSSRTRTRRGGINVKGLLRQAASCGSCRSSTPTATTTPSPRRPRACGARTCATTTATARSPTSTASTPTATGPRSGTTTSRARRTTRPRRPSTAPARPPSPRSRRCAASSSASTRPS